jgi:molecular chaperone DnaK (HSP70)
MIAPMVARLESPMARALEISGISKEDIESVEIIGGTTRIPAVKQAIGTFFGKESSTTLNQDECVAKGCALMVCFAVTRGTR